MLVVAVPAAAVPGCAHEPVLGNPLPPHELDIDDVVDAVVLVFVLDVVVVDCPPNAGAAVVVVVPVPVLVPA